MDFNDIGFRSFIAETKAKAELQLNSVNVGQEFKEVISDLLKIAEGTENLLRSGVGQSADVRVLKNKFEQTKTELFQVKKLLDKTRKNMFAALSDEVVTVTTQLKNINKIVQDNETVLKCSQAIQNSMKNLVNKIAEINKDS
ncbi:MAG: hypothetical protein KDD58_06525 [Bdellovibrionales bacterium]|nr:hypothetical protein [Bdellovibrionales bacterium]